MEQVVWRELQILKEILKISWLLPLHPVSMERELEFRNPEGTNVVIRVHVYTASRRVSNIYSVILVVDNYIENKYKYSIQYLLIFYLFVAYLTMLSILIPWLCDHLSTWSSCPTDAHSFIHSSVTLQIFVGPCTLFQFLDFFTQSVGLLGRGSARRKVATCRQNSTNTE
jgi:hypothetical protein